MPHDFAKISVTAKLAAYMRQFSDIPYAADIADLTRARATFDQLLRDHTLSPDDLTWYAPIFEARHKSIGAMIARTRAGQVLELAAGLSPRGLQITADPRYYYVETDLDDILAEKRLLLSAIQRRHRLQPRNNHRLAAANAIDPAQLLAAAKNFKSSQRLLITHEGLLQYLSSSETEQVTHNIHHLLGKFGGAWITPDFSLKSDSDNASDAQKLFRRIIAEATDRTLYNNAFDSIEHLREYFRGLGFQVEVFNQLYLAPDLASPARLHLAPEVLDHLRPKLRLWMLTRLP
ncbi:MAG TPA: class I SAM-dependent methyltransferase [Candidatus Methylacidiphilales bacterium]|jgi:O-methyltransferase involved in polyketide biosynthesis|nr:class I SAM-dependent methyltransferase [Candidatus Methylacidiphilales bacterium]